MTELFPHLVSAWTDQAPVRLVYAALLTCLVLRIWIAALFVSLPHDQRPAFRLRTAGLAEWAENLPLVLGVIATLTGISYEVMARGSVQEAVEAFRLAFGMGVGRTIAGGWIYALGCLLNGLEDLLESRHETP